MNGRRAKKLRELAHLGAQFTDKGETLETFAIKEHGGRIKQLPDGTQYRVEPFTTSYTEGTYNYHYKMLKKYWKLNKLSKLTS